ncbi:hypothetical protein HIM_00915 [Hirsutella minnesotensis 3608]|nr:hypothetical protein HIM_00915 [Hirsutella minnesotensis 3608]
MAEESRSRPPPPAATAPEPVKMTEKKRRRPALACEQCRRRKIRCDRKSPCGHCDKARIASCTYIPTHVPASKTKKLPSNNDHGLAAEAFAKRVPTQGGDPEGDGHAVGEGPKSRLASDPARPSTRSAPSSTAGSASESSNVEWLVARVHELEEKLARVVHIHDDVSSPQKHGPAELSKVFTGTVSKTRYFGQTHWMSVRGLLPVEFGLLGPGESERTGAYPALLKCKNLARRIKEFRHRPLSSESIGKQIPSRDMSDKLIESYLGTFEGVLRILHVPSFRADYERYWQNPEAANEAFVVQLQLCLALGSTLHDELFTMRAWAAQWIYEAQLWLMLPPEKSRMTIPSIQIMCLLILAKSTCGVGSDLAWITTGALVRQAMLMGLHRDPRHLGQMTTFRAEMRRRLWATVLELNLQSSFEASGPPLQSTNDYDTQSPANVNDEELSDENDGVQPLGQPLDHPTQTSVQIMILQSLPLRLDLLRKANEFRHTQPYDETLRLNSELTKACRELSQSLLFLQNKASGLSRTRITAFHVSMAEMITYRCFHALHQTVIAHSFDDDKFYFSRRMCLDSALKLMHVAGLCGPLPASTADGAAEFRRIAINGTGLFRYVPAHALFFVAIELIYEKKGGGGSLGYLPSPGNSDLYSCLESAMGWTIDRIRSGETNVKCHCFVAAILSHVDALAAGLDGEQVEAAVLKSGIAALGRCLHELEEVAHRVGVSTEDVDGVAALENTAEMAMDWMEDWAWDDMGGLLWPSETFEAMIPGQFSGF